MTKTIKSITKKITLGTALFLVLSPLTAFAATTCRPLPPMSNTAVNQGRAASDRAFGVLHAFTSRLHQ